MKNIKIKINIISIFLFVILSCGSVFAAKYTLTSGKEFNARIKCAIDSSFNSTTVEKTIIGFERSDIIPEGVKLIDISEDGDSSILAFIKDNIIYYVSDDEVYFSKDMSYMFDKFLSIKNINLTDFDFSKCKKMNYMFGNCLSLTNLDMDNDTYIYPTEIEGMFYNCQSLVDLNIYMLNTKSVTSFKNLFNNCKNIKNIEVSNDNFITTKVKNFDGMFKNCYMLKTNFGNKAIDMTENLYKIYARTGDDDIEGLLKDYDFEYDDYGRSDGSYKIDSINTKILDAAGNANISDNINDEDIKNLKKYIDVEISTDSSLNVISTKNTKKITDEDVTALLMSESTYVPDFEERIKERRLREQQALDKGLEEEETTDSSFVPGRVSRPTLDEYKKRSTKDGRDIDEETEIKKYTIVDSSIIFVIIGIVMIVIASVLFYRKKQKKEDEDLNGF